MHKYNQPCGPRSLPVAEKTTALTAESSWAALLPRISWNDERQSTWFLTLANTSMSDKTFGRQNRRQIADIQLTFHGVASLQHSQGHLLSLYSTCNEVSLPGRVIRKGKDIQSEQVLDGFCSLPFKLILINFWIYIPGNGGSPPGPAARVVSIERCISSEA